ncbi:MAG: carbohydrate porin [Candidatus Accumulibacter sp.]|uniref:carbohydrate porin n=1 Tax=Accumulibacter sp. TaxID=2053492 RepID=UPI001D75569C|nr:carbohydrate porin [Accumulibacter sp.]MCB1940668.1 carbohydrate porin [Accumulibacter sp.]MCP5247397.1 carbohydrate porin [Accumulibacter sp.]
MTLAIDALGATRGAMLLVALLTQPLAAHAAGAGGASEADERPDSVPVGEQPATEAPPDWRESTLSGDWGGARKRLYDAGVQVDALYTADYLRNTTGGLQRGGAYMGHLDLAVQLDGQKLLGWQGATAYLQLISNAGGRFNLNYVGSLMGVDNLEAPVNRSGIFQAWLQQSFLDDKASLRVGLYPIDSEFYITESSGVFIHPSFGMAAEAADFGTLAGPSIYATSTYGARLRIDPDPSWYAMLAITRGVSSDRAATAGPNISWQLGSGSMLIGEIGLSPARAGLLGERPALAGNRDDGFEAISKLAVGAWRFTPQFPELVAVNAAGEPALATHWGAYLLGEQTVYRAPESKRSVTTFVRYGVTDGQTNNIDYSVSAGLNCRGLFASREDDVFGIAATRAHVGPQGRTLLASDVGSPLTASAESVVELTYQAPLLPGVVVQPVAQRIFNPGLHLPNSTVVGARLQIAL